MHDEAELARALDLGAEMIGINNRDLHSFATDLGVTLRLVPQVPRDVLVVAESGLGSRADLERLAQAGVTTFPDRRKPDAAGRCRRRDAGADRR